LIDGGDGDHLRQRTRIGGRRIRAGIARRGDQHRAPGARTADGKGHQRIVIACQADIHHPHMVLDHPVEHLGDGKGIRLALAPLAREDGGGIEIGVGQEAAPAGMRRIGRATSTAHAQSLHPFRRTPVVASGRHVRNALKLW
jgi:hypothetical protein